MRQNFVCGWTLYVKRYKIDVTCNCLYIHRHNVCVFTDVCKYTDIKKCLCFHRLIPTAIQWHTHCPITAFDSSVVIAKKWIWIDMSLGTWHMTIYKWHTNCAKILTAYKWDRSTIVQTPFFVFTNYSENLC